MRIDRQRVFADPAALVMRTDRPRAALVMRIDRQRVLASSGSKPHDLTVLAAIAIVAMLAMARTARADRPVLAGAQAFGVPNGRVLVHYATSGGDAVPLDDADSDGVPDFVELVAVEAEFAVAEFAARGLRAPIRDGTLGGDDRIDIYLRDLAGADGSTALDRCDGNRCAGHAIAENDFNGYSYPSRVEAIRSVVPHELFHLVQLAYANDQPSTWTEGSAVWAVEAIYGDGNADFERFLPAFLGKTFRPFERPAAGFGDAYPYGAALWPYFLARRFDPAIVGEIWTACESQPWLDATASALAARTAALPADTLDRARIALSSATTTPAETLDRTWIELTRWNAFTGAYANDATSGYGTTASAWPEAPREAPITSSTTTATIYVEGYSARYVPVILDERAQITATANVAIAAWAGAALDDGIELVDGAAVVEPGSYTLVVTGLARNTITSPVTIAIAPPPVEPDAPEGDDGSGCAATTGSSWIALLALARLQQRRRRRQPPSRGDDETAVRNSDEGGLDPRGHEGSAVAER